MKPETDGAISISHPVSRLLAGFIIIAGISLGAGIIQQPVFAQRSELFQPLVQPQQNLRQIVSIACNDLAGNPLPIFPGTDLYIVDVEQRFTCSITLGPGVGGLLMTQLGFKSYSDDDEIIVGNGGNILPDSLVETISIRSIGPISRGPGEMEWKLGYADTGVWTNEEQWQQVKRVRFCVGIKGRSYLGLVNKD